MFYISFYTLIFFLIVKTDIEASSSSNIALNVGQNVKIKNKSEELYFEGENSKINYINSKKDEGEKLFYE